MTKSTIGTEAVPRCPLCSYEPCDLLYAGLRDRLFGAPEGWNLKWCRRCGCVFLDPRPTENEIHKAYQTYYTHQKDASAHRRGSLWKASKAIYHVLNDAARHVLSVDEEYERIQSMYLGSRRPGKVLDIGCGQGRFLARMCSRGWDVEGTETDSKAAEIARSEHALKVRVGDIRNLSYPSNHLDAITMNHVIEHVHDPIGLLKECRRVLKPGGVLVAVTPNVRSWGHRRFGRDWRDLDPPRHLTLFSPEALKRCSRQAGYELIDVWTTPANAEVVFAGSLSLRRHGEYDMSAKPPIVHAFSANVLQLYEAATIKRQPEVGEEAVLWLEK